MQKPEYLYHASSCINISEFEPRNESPRYQGEVNLVFATPYLGVAAMFLVSRDIPTEISIYGDKYVVFINSSEADYSLKDKGGAIYILPTDTFETDSINGMGEIEWVSKVSVRPISKEIFETSMKAMDKYDVDRYFVSDATFQQIQADPAHALNLVK